MEAASSESFGQLLKRYRRAAELTQEALAEQAGYSAIYLRKLERGERFPLAFTVEALADALRLTPAERASLRAAARRLEASRSPQRPLRSTGGGALSPLAGRATELAALKRHLAGEGPPLLLLAGEPGIGKTRLLQEIAFWGQEQEMSVLSGGCHRRSAQEPYAPFVDVLARAITRRSPAERKEALEGCGWLARLLPELAEEGVSTPNLMLAPGQERRLMFAAVGQFLMNTAGPAGTLLLLDDLQWAGEDALDLLASLVRSESAHSLRVIGAYRLTETRPSNPLGHLLADLAREGLAARTELGPLDTDEATLLLKDLLADLEPEHQERLTGPVLRRAGGVPYFLVSCAQELRSRPAHDQTTSESEKTIPWNVAESIRQRVALLPEAAQYLLGAAAVVGREIERTLLFTLAAPLEWGQRDILAALDTICQARLLVELNEERYAFAHDLIREVVGADLSAARRTALHEQVAEALEQQPGAAPVERLAHHYHRAGRLDKAAIYLERSANRAEAMYAHIEAERFIRELIDCLTRLGRDAQVIEAREKLWNILVKQARFHDALDILQQLLPFYQASTDLEGLARIMGKIGQTEATRGNSDAGIALIEPWLASPDVQKLSPQTRGALYATLTFLFQNSGRFPEALKAAEQALALIEQSGDERLLGVARWYLGRSLMLLQRVNEAIPYLEAAIPLVERTGDLRSLYYALLNLDLAYEVRGELHTARGYIEQALALAEQIGDPFLIGHILAAHGYNAFLLGAWQQARDELERAIALLRQAGAPWGTEYPLLNLGALLLCEGHWEAAAPCFDEAIALAERNQHLEVFRLVQNTLAERELLMGQPGQARDRLAPLLEGLDSAETGVLFMLTSLAWACLELGEEAQAQQFLEQVISRAASQQVRVALAEALPIKARLAARRSRWEEAARALDEALALARGMPAPHIEAKALYAAGLIAHQQGDTARAREQFAAALAILVRLGERLYAGRVEEALAQLEREDKGTISRSQGQSVR
jgi:tetratricopeptide (TPR) repeat protein